MKISNFYLNLGHNINTFLPMKNGVCLTFSEKGKLRKKLNKSDFSK